MVESADSLDALVDGLRAITARSADPKAIIKQVAPLARSMAAKSDWIQPSYYDCNSDQGFGITILHEEEDHTLLVEAIAWLPGRGVAPHDHQTWGVVVGLVAFHRGYDGLTWFQLRTGRLCGAMRI